MTALLLALLTADPCPEPGPKFEAKLDGGTKFVAKIERGVPVWVISGPGAGGSGKVTLKSGSAKKVIIRFAGQRTMAGFKAAVNGKGIYAGLGQTVRVNASGAVTVRPADAVLTLTIRPGKDCIEAVLDAKDEPKEWVFGWKN